MELILQGKDGERLDVALARELGLSRAQVQRAIKEGRVTVSGGPAKAHGQVAPGTPIAISEPAAEERAHLPFPKLEILYEDNDVLAVTKPSGVLVHPTGASKEPTLLDAVLEHEPKIAKVGDDRLRAGIVHRLDKEASGVLVVAKNQHAFHFLKEQFKNRLVEKHYLVLVLGNVKEQVGTIDFPIARSTNRPRMAARPKSQEGKEAITHFTVLERFTTASLLDVKIETGRTHQIRAHFFALGHPVAGDSLYRQRNIKPIAVPRLFLHAKELTITLPSGDRKTFKAPLPKELELFLEQLKPLSR